jgi:MFS family permease
LTVSNKIPATIGVFLLGVGFAATYPVILGYIGELYPKMSGTAFSLALTIALMGGMLIPYLAGLIGGHFGLRRSFLIIPAALISIFILLLIVSRRFSQIKEKDLKFQSTEL